MLENEQNPNSVPSDGAKAESSNQAEETTSSQRFGNAVLAAVHDELEKELDELSDFVNIRIAEIIKKCPTAFTVHAMSTKYWDVNEDKKRKYPHVRIGLVLS